MVMDCVLSHLLRLLHPFMPHITEELWERLGFAGTNHGQGNLVMFADFPSRIHAARGERHRRRPGAGGRCLRLDRRRPESAGRVPDSARARRSTSSSNPPWPGSADQLPTFARLINAEQVRLDPGYEAPGGVPRVLTPLGELYMPLEGVVDASAELDRVQKEIAKVENELTVVRRKLANESFVANAPAAVVQEHRQRETDWAEKLAQLTRMRESLG